MGSQPPWVPIRPDAGAVAYAPPPFPLPPPGRPPGRSRVPTVLVSISAVLLVVGLIVGAIDGFGPQGQTRQRHYTFLRVFDGEPVRWNPCNSIHYVVNLELAPEGALADVKGAVQHVSEATGIYFVYDGQTRETPGQLRKVYQPKRYGDQWAPVLIAWVDPNDSQIRFGKPGDYALGLGLPLYSPAGSSPLQYVSGEISINSKYQGRHGFEYPGDLGLVVQHELGHVMGLGHADVAGELMGRSGGGATDWGSGDLEGLRQLGSSQGCFSTPDPP